MMKAANARLVLLSVAVLAAATGARAPHPADDQPRRLHQAPPAKTVSPSPKKAEWEGAEPVELLHPLPRGCEARLLREWLRVVCRQRRPASLSLLSGQRQGVGMWLAKGDDPNNSYLEILLPLRRGDRRLIQLTEFAEAESFRGIGEQRVGFILSEQWTEDMKAPWVALH